ncbi:HAD domain-containing protein, partial [Salmonella enterica]|uniref:HAD domain-containing protein n=1 Tax=Salmonella enterica TaxID=28901 RepID=UPI0020B108DB
RDRVIGATPSLYLPSGSIGVRAAECEDFVTRHKVKAFICLDDDATLFPPEYPHLFRTDYYTGVNEKDLTDLIARYSTPSIQPKPLMRYSLGTKASVDSEKLLFSQFSF